MGDHQESDYYSYHHPDNGTEQHPLNNNPYVYGQGSTTSSAATNNNLYFLQSQTAGLVEQQQQQQQFPQLGGVTDSNNQQLYNSSMAIGSHHTSTAPSLSNSYPTLDGGRRTFLSSSSSSNGMYPLMGNNNNRSNYNPIMPLPPDMTWRNNGLSSWDDVHSTTYAAASQPTMNDWIRSPQQQQQQELHYQSQVPPQNYHEQQLQSQRCQQQQNVMVQQYHHRLNLPPIPPPLCHSPPPPLPPTQEEEGDGSSSNNMNSLVSVSRERLGDTTVTTHISREECTGQVPIAAKSKPLVVASSAKFDPSDTVIDAFNALSDLQSRWTNPAVVVGDKRKVIHETNTTIDDTPTTSSQKSKKKRRKRGKKKNNDDDVVVIDSNNDADEEKWIDVEDDSLAKYQSSTLLSSSSCAIRSIIDFPPLIKSDDNDDDPALATSLDRLSTSELTSYAAVLQGALDQSDDVALNPSSIPLHGVEMTTTTKTSENQATRIIVLNTIEVIDLSNDREEDQRGDGEVAEMSNSTMLLPIDPTPRIMANAVSSTREEDGGGEKEKRALKLNELKAKAKLAKAKLRLAEQKKDRVRALTPIPSSISPLPTKLDDITALREINSLVINDVSIAGPTNEVRFVDSDFRSQYNNKPTVRVPIPPLTTSRYGKTTSWRTTVQDSTYTSNTQPTTLHKNVDEQKMKTKSLTQQIQLAKLQLQIKKKVKEKRELVKKMKLQSDSKADSASTKPPPKETEGIDSINQLVYNTQAISQLPLMNATMDEMNVVNNNSIDDSMKVSSEESAALDVAESRAKLELLRRRQKKLKQENEIANLKNMIQRQQELLGQVSQELTDNTNQLQSCESRIKLKQALLDTSEKKLDEMNRRKKIIETMVLRATEQVMAARKALSNRQQLG